MSYIYKVLLALTSFLGNAYFTNANQEETALRNALFSNYNPKVRPVENIDSQLTVQMGLALQNIEKFVFDDINYVDSDYFYLRIYR